MDKAEFDKFADEYRDLHARNIRLSGEGPDYFAEYKVRAVAQHLGSMAGIVSRVLDFGAGVGTSVPWFRRYFPQASLTCVDVSERSLQIGASRFAGQAQFVPCDGGSLPMHDGQVELAFAACVFHHIDENEHVGLLRELRRVLAPDGLLAIFEHNPMNPLTVSAVRNCPFDENAKLILPRTLCARLHQAGFEAVTVQFCVFFPAALRALRVTEPMLGWCPLGAQYVAYAKRGAGA